MSKAIMSVLAVLALNGCAGSLPPSAESLNALPVVSYPDAPPTGDFIYKLPAGKPIDVRVLVDGNALMDKVEQTVSGQLRKDLYLYKRWASEDRTHWVKANELIGVHVRMTLPSYEAPRPGELHLTVTRRTQEGGAAVAPGKRLPYFGFAFSFKRALREMRIDVEKVIPDSPAQASGLQTHDYIVALDGQRNFQSAHEVLDYLLRKPVGSLLKLDVVRGSAPLSITVLAAEADEAQQTRIMHRLEESRVEQDGK